MEYITELFQVASLSEDLRKVFFTLIGEFYALNKDT